MPLVILTVVWLVFSLNIASAADASQTCGAPPVFDKKTESDEKTQANLDGKAQALLKLFGSAQLGGTIKTDKKEIFESASSSEAARQVAYYGHSEFPVRNGTERVRPTALTIFAVRNMLLGLRRQPTATIAA